MERRADVEPNRNVIILGNVSPGSPSSASKFREPASVVLVSSYGLTRTFRADHALVRDWTKRSKVAQTGFGGPRLFVVMREEPRTYKTGRATPPERIHMVVLRT